MQAIIPLFRLKEILHNTYQEIMILPTGASRFEEALQMGFETCHYLKKLGNAVLGLPYVLASLSFSYEIFVLKFDNNHPVKSLQMAEFDHKAGYRHIDCAMVYDNEKEPRSCSRAMKAVGVVEATCEEIFELVMSMDGTRFE
ncbi:hypothetical protein RIF29_03788 [Crotalaria pallida]|uniref:phosphopyruvate hydratase n=1 Tax=Crotalaria pallida TaxID=3830 RepID=A0AAN9J2S0_CROPI